jgi:cytosine/adenosine deaminase-related metal-dependent hydrolase
MMLYHHAIVITMNSTRQIIEHGAVVVNGNLIVDVGQSKEMLERYPAEPQTDCNGYILLPGLIDTHVHMGQCMLRGISEGMNHADLGSWLFNRIFPLQGSYTEADGRASAALCILEMLKSGTTGFIECLLAENYGFDGIAELVVQSGIRAALGKVVMDWSPEIRDSLGMHTGMWQSRESSIKNTLSAFDQWNGAAEGRLQVWFGCRSAEPANNPSLFDEVSQLAKLRNMGIAIHLAEFDADNNYAQSLGYRSHVEFAQGHGLLGPRTVLAHCGASDLEDWKLLTASRTSVAHNPANNAAAGWRTSPIVEMLEAGVNVALGCDGAPTNTNMDLLRDLRVTAQVARARAQSPMVMSSETVLELATLNGSTALGIAPQVGSIEPGKRADFIIINTDAPHLTPVWNPVAAVVFGAQGSDVDTVVVDGQILMQARKVITMDEGVILDDVRKRYRDVALRAGIQDIRPNWPIN